MINIRIANKSNQWEYQIRKGRDEVIAEECGMASQRDTLEVLGHVLLEMAEGEEL